ncbi:19942_t:CDS:2 [Rhizophagus irregularis]|nr:19942_t:CDS:2 [Rhizophagus irregularis]
MPPIRDYKSASPISQHQNPSSSGEDDIENLSPKSDKSLSMVDKKRGKRSPSINTRASRVGVTNFINVIKSLHPGESINYFPITKETLQEYIDSKRKALIKAGSLEQYLQHIQAYNIALGFGWDGHVFGPIIKKALDELRIYEDETSLKTGNILVVSSGQQQQPTLVNSVISQQLQQTQPFSSLDNNFLTSSNNDLSMNLITIDEDEDTNKLSYDDPIDEDISPLNEQTAKVSLDNLTSPDPIQNLRQLYSNVSSLNIPKSWGNVDTSKLHYRIGTSEESFHYGLIDVSAFNRFWSSFNEPEVGRDVQLIVYRESISLLTSGQRRFNASPEPMYPTSQPQSPNRRSLALKSVTVRSKTKVYKQKIAVADTTTFATLISFAIKVQPPTGKQFVIRAADGALEYMPDDLVREVITGVEHTEIIVCIEDVGPPVNFDYF